MSNKNLLIISYKVLNNNIDLYTISVMYLIIIEIIKYLVIIKI